MTAALKLERDIGPYRFSLREFGDATQLPRHHHDDAFVTIVVEGRLVEQLSGTSHDCGTWDVVVHAPGEQHANRFAGRRTRCLRVQGVSFERTACFSSPAAAAIASKLVQEFRHPDTFSPLVIEAAMLELHAMSGRQNARARMPRWLPRVIAAVDAGYQAPLSIAALARDADIHPAHLARAFREHCGQTLGERVRALRVEYARQRLATDAPLHEIAGDAGFADQSHFTRTFRRALGMTPSAYRRNLRR